MFGSHLSISGGLYNALLDAERLGFQTVQIFTKNQQQWRSPPLLPEVVTRWKSECERLGFSVTVAHAGYLINLASPDETLWVKSLELFVEELSRCQALGIPYLVIHPGAHMGAGEEAGFARVALALDTAHRALPDCPVLTCLEVTAGQGSSLGHRLEHLADIRGRVEHPQRIAYCLDTAHLFAAGYDFRGRRYAPFMREVDRILGLERIKAIHLNDSKRELGSRVDRHEHIGHGTIGAEGIAPFVRDPRFAKIPLILETPKEKDDHGRDWDEINLETLRSLAATSRKRRAAND